jgi:hypothetical protein
MLGDVVSFQGWPQANADKVPSMISFSDSNGSYSQYGYEIAPKSMTLQWNKLELKDPEDRGAELRMLEKALHDLALLEDLRNPAMSDEDRDNIVVPGHVGKTPEDVVTEYMKRLASRFQREVDANEGRAVLDNNIVDVVVTHPADGVSIPYKSMCLTTIGKKVLVVDKASLGTRYGNTRQRTRL